MGRNKITCIKKTLVQHLALNQFFPTALRYLQRCENHRQGSQMGTTETDLSEIASIFNENPHGLSVKGSTARTASSISHHQLILTWEWKGLNINSWCAFRGALASWLARTSQSTSRCYCWLCFHSRSASPRPTEVLKGYLWTHKGLLTSLGYWWASHLLWWTFPCFGSRS